MLVWPTSRTGSYFTRANLGSIGVILHPRKVAKDSDMTLMDKLLSSLTLQLLISRISSVQARTLTRNFPWFLSDILLAQKLKKLKKMEKCAPKPNKLERKGKSLKHREVAGQYRNVLVLRTILCYIQTTMYQYQYQYN